MSISLALADKVSLSDAEIQGDKNYGFDAEKSMLLRDDQ